MTSLKQISLLLYLLTDLNKFTKYSMLYERIVATYSIETSLNETRSSSSFFSMTSTSTFWSSFMIS